MRNARTILGIIRKRGAEGKSLDQIYRMLFNPELYIAAYAKIGSNKGAMTKGVTDETVDGMSHKKIRGGSMTLSVFCVMRDISSPQPEGSILRKRTGKCVLLACQHGVISCSRRSCV